MWNILKSIDFRLSVDEILFAVLFALFLTFIIQNVIRFKKIINEGPIDFEPGYEDIERIIERCRKLFPIDKLLFDGKTYTSGTVIRITTMQNKSYEGEFIGVNSKNMVCIMSKRYIIAHEIKNISKITVTDK